ncbi:polyphosphate kinase 1 [Candidatus Amarolinea aalborgensis]|uniref:polyphosphate kinase 1 n=1 Tax=Candidatus Amarolinea aalborgensis TaxID=2249329 RepID=UPI003BFA1762
MSETAPEKAVSLRDSLYLNRELSWIEFNRRVLQEAQNQNAPLLERVKFLSIFSSNLDEFFMIRVSGLREQIAAGVTQRTPDGMTPAEQLDAVRAALLPLLDEQTRVLTDDLIPKLAGQGIRLLNYDELTPAQRAALRTYYEREIFPVLTPLAFDAAHPFPRISNLSLNLAVLINDPEYGERFARVKVPSNLARLIPLHELAPLTRAQDGSAPFPYKSMAFVWIEQVIAANLADLFVGMEIMAAYPFRIIRDTDIEIQEDEADDLLLTIEQGIRQRRFGNCVRLEIGAGMPDRVRHTLLEKLQLDSGAVYASSGPLGLSSLMELHSLDRPGLKDRPFPAAVPSIFSSESDIFSAIRRQDILLHHPYDSFTPVVDLIRTASEDPNVLAIKMTLYRVGSRSPIVDALMEAGENGKHVAVLVELKARFDEENNIVWARALERSGVHVVYGVLGLKTHCKLALIVRRERDGIHRYVHLGTGNYNATTARIYTDLGLMTCREDIASDVSDVFNFLTGFSNPKTYRKLGVAPVSLRETIRDLIRNEIKYGKDGHLIFKVNALLDPAMIEDLYKASQAGVRVDLIVRGICCIRPGLPGVSETIRVISIVGRFLEHSRIYYARNNGDEQVYLSSADLMQRNLDRRVEALFPVEDPALKTVVRQQILDLCLADTVKARQLNSDGSYTWVKPDADHPPLDSQHSLRYNRTPLGAF